MRTSVLLKKHNQGLRQLLLTTVLGPPRLAWHNWRCPCISVVPPWGPLNGAVSAKKALQVSKTEKRGRTTENNVFPMRGYWFALQGRQVSSIHSSRVRDVSFTLTFHWFGQQAIQWFFANDYEKQVEENWVGQLRPVGMMVKAEGWGMLQDTWGHLNHSGKSHSCRWPAAGKEASSDSKCLGYGLWIWPTFWPPTPLKTF